MIIYIIYQTTNLVNKKFYIGKHRQSDTNFDGYLGSGKLLKAAVKKYGKENFIRKTLYIFHNEQECFDKEKELLSPLLEDRNCYNIASGGIGASSGKHNPNYNARAFTEETIKHFSKIRKGKRLGSDNPFYGQTHSDQTLEKIRKTKMTGLYITPKGEYNSSVVAAKENNISRDSVRKWCKGNSNLVTKAMIYQTAFLKQDDLGKSFKELGFDYISYI